MATTITTNQKVSVAVQFTDDEGNPKAITEIEWTSDNEAVAVVEQSADDPAAATVHTGDDVSELGAAVISATDPATGVSVAGVVEVTAGDVAAGTLTFGDPEAE